MKRLLSISLIVVLCLVLITSVAFFVYSIVDINRIMNELSNDPSDSACRAHPKKSQPKHNALVDSFLV